MAERTVITIPELPPETEVFAEPWETRAFALAVELAAHGHFRWTEFRACLIEEIAAEDSSPAGESGDHRTSERNGGYYRCWLRALERLTLAKGILDRASIDRQAESIAASPPARTRAHGRGPIRIA
jgi:nitrile hydratase accessory protein